jgi:hypothetical protein
MFTKTLAQYKTRIENLADINGQVGSGSTYRHSTTIVDEIADETYRRLRSLVARKGFREYHVQTAKAALPTTAVSTGEEFATIAYPTGATHIRGFDVLQNGYWRRLKHLDGWSERRDHQSTTQAFQNERPYAWDVLSHGSVATTVLTAGTIAIFPVPVDGDYTLWYLPEWASIAGNDTYIFLYREQCWYDYHVFQGVLEICAIRDNDSARRAAKAQEMSDAAEKAIGEFTADETADGVRSWTRDRRNYHR